MKRRWVFGISGASGMRYAIRALQVLSEASDLELHIVCSEAALRVLKEEEGISAPPSKELAEVFGLSKKAETFWYNPRDIGAAVASGSFKYDGMVVLPCSMGTVAAIAAGFSMNLLQRAADVTLKEGRRLILVPRETPLSVIHLENLTRLARAGVTIVPAMPGFYHQPKTLEEIIDMMVMKVLDVMGIENDLVKRWE